MSEVYEVKKGIGKIYFYLEEKKVDVEVVKMVLEKLNVVICLKVVWFYCDDYCVCFIENDAYI